MTLKQICRAAERDKLLPKGETLDIFAEIHPPKYKAKEKRPLTEEETAALSYTELSEKERAFVSLRREEALALTVFDVNFKDSLIKISKAVAFDGNNPYIKAPKSRNSYRNVPMCAELADILKPYSLSLSGTNLFEKFAGGLITHSAYVKMLDSIRNKLKKSYIEHSGVRMPDWGHVGFEDLTAHIFRHNYCTRLCYAMAEGHNLTTKKIAALLGDSEKMVLDVYSHIMEEKERPIISIKP